MGFVTALPVLKLSAEEAGFQDESLSDLDEFVVLFGELDVVGKDGSFADLLKEVSHVVSGGVPCLAHSFSVCVDVEGVDAAPFVEDAVEESDESAIGDAGEKALELEAILALEFVLGKCNQCLVAVFHLVF